MMLIGAVVVPALDALCLKLRSLMPSFKKKGGALAAQITEVQNSMWIATKTCLKSL